MKKQSSKFVCSQCGATSSSWAGRCSQCGEWNTIEEEAQLLTGTTVLAGSSLQPASVSDVVAIEQKRITTTIAEADAVLGGGIVPGSVVLLAGQPGIGKSTLLLQLAHGIAQKQRVLYVSAEESVQQVGLRATRLGSNQGELALVSSTSADDIAATILTGNMDCVIVDSIQTVSCSAVTSAPGSISQITNATNLLMQAAKRSNTAVIIVGHVTKEGSIAGPKVLEHLVDVVLQLEGDRFGGFKILRTIKNRFGSTSEAGIFEMTEAGLQPVYNPSAALLAERQQSDGSVVLATMEGTRPILVEVQALVNKTSYGYPKRTASGIDPNRVNLLIAVLEKRTKLRLAEDDIYINIVGGVKLSERAADLAICMAIASAAKGMQLGTDAVVFGEVGLSGEVRQVPFMEQRLKEVAKMGFTTVLGPKTRDGKLARHAAATELICVSTLRDALNTYLKKSV